MKKLNYLICGLILSIIPCLNASAMEEIFYINQNGVEMTPDSCFVKNLWKTLYHLYKI